MEITGRIIQKLDMQKGASAKGEWKKQEFIIETNDKFPKKVCVSAWSEKVDDLTRFNINDTVKVSYNLESREYNGRWYTDARAWKIQGSGAAAQSPEADPFHPDNEPGFNSDSASDDLPF